MSHYTVLVALPAEVARDDIDDALAKVLDPFDENGHAEPIEEDGETYWRNPSAKWDWWTVGGRWANYFLRSDAVGAADVIVMDPDSDHCDGGRKYALDLDARRAQEGEKAAGYWDEYAATIAGTADALPWSVFVEKVDQSGNDGYSFDEARADYAAQERIQAVRKSETFKYWFGGLEDLDSLNRAQYVERGIARAVPGYATLDGVFDGVWMAPGEMGWFAASTDTPGEYDDYVKRANAYVDSLPDDVWLVIVDCHI